MDLLSSAFGISELYGHTESIRISLVMVPGYILGPVVPCLAVVKVAVVFAVARDFCRPLGKPLVESILR